MAQDIVKRIRIVAATEGVEAASAALDKLTGAHTRVGQSAESMARSTQSGYRGLDIGRSLDRELRKVDDVYRSQQAFARSQTVFDRALESGRLTIEGHASALDKARARYGQFGQANDNAAKSIGLARHELQNLAYQASDVFSSLSSGSSPFTVLMQQGPQVAQVLGGAQGGVGAAMKDLAARATGLLTPTAAVAAGFFTVAGAAIAASLASARYEEQQRDIERAVGGVGRSTGATVDVINRLSLGSADTGRVSISTARTLASEYAATGSVQSDMFSGLIGIAQRYARTVGSDLTRANTELAGAFASPVEGALKLNQRFGFLTGSTLEQIRRFDEMGDRLGAQRTLMEAFGPALTKASGQTSAWAEAWDAVSRKASNAADAIGRASAPPSLPDRQRSLMDRLRTNDTNAEPDYVSHLRDELKLSEQQIRALVPSYKPMAPAQVEQTTVNLSDIQEQQRRKGALDYQRMIDQLDSAASLRANELTRKAFPDYFDFEKLSGDAAKFERALKSATTLDDASLAQRALDQISEKMKAGGASALALQKAARDAFSVQGLNAYDRALTEIGHKYRELREAAGGSASILSGQALAQADEVRTLRAQTRERALGQVAIPQDYLPTIRRLESGSDDSARSSSGALGRFQFTEGTWIEQFKRYKGDLFQSMRQEFPEGAGGDERHRRAVLGLRTNPTYQDELAGTLTRENAEQLSRRGFDATTRNLYGAHVVGAGGISALLEAERSGGGGQSAQAILDAVDKRLVANNKSYFGNGKSVEESLGTLDRLTLQKSSVSRGQEDQTRRLESETRSIDLQGDALIRRRSVEEQLTAAREQGLSVADRFKSVDELLANGTRGLTGELQSQTAVILANADARARATRSLSETSLQRSIDQERRSLGMSQGEIRIDSRLRSAGVGPDDPQRDFYAGQMRTNATLAETKSLAGDALKGFVSDLRQGASASEALQGSLNRILDRLQSKAIDGLLDGLFKPGSGGGGGLGSILSMFGGSSGGYGASNYASAAASAAPGMFGPGFADGGLIRGPGGPRSDSILARVSAGEFIVNASATARHRETLSAINDNRMPRFADGGMVPLPTTIPVSMTPPMAVTAPVSPAATTVTVHNYGKTQVETQESRGPGGTRNIDIMVRDLEDKLASRVMGSQSSLGAAARSPIYANNRG